MFVLVTELAPFGLDESFVLDCGGALSELPSETLLFNLVHAAGAGGGAGLNKGHDLHRRSRVGGNGEFDEGSFMEGFALTIDGLVHQQSPLAIDDMAAAVFLVPAEDMGMLDDDGIGTHLDHEPAGVLDAGAGGKKLITAMEQDDEVIELVAVSRDVADEIDQVERVGAGGVLGSDGELMLGDGENANLEATQVSDEDATGGVEVWAGADGSDAGLGTDRKGILKAGGAVVEDMVIGQVKNSDASLLDGVNASAGFAEDRAGLGDRRALVNEGTFEVCNGHVSLLKLGKQIIKEGARIAFFKVRPIGSDGAEIGADDNGRHWANGWRAC